MQSKQLHRDLNSEVTRLKMNYNLMKEIIYELEENYQSDFEKLTQEIRFLKNRIRQLEKTVEKLQDQLESQRQLQTIIPRGE